MSRPFVSNYRVYYEDTDAAGIVYYANYLKFAERARTDVLRDLGINQKELLAKEGLGFVVHHVEVDYHAAAELDDLLHVETALQEIRKVRMTMKQDIVCEDRLLVSMRVDIAMVDSMRKPTRIPEKIIGKLKERI